MNKADKTPGFQTLLLSAMKLLECLSLDNLSFHTSVIFRISLDLSPAWGTLSPLGQPLSLTLNPEFQNLNFWKDNERENNSPGIIVIPFFLLIEVFLFYS